MRTNNTIVGALLMAALCAGQSALARPVIEASPVAGAMDRQALKVEALSAAATREFIDGVSAERSAALLETARAASRRALDARFDDSRLTRVPTASSPEVSVRAMPAGDGAGVVSLTAR